MLKSNHKILKRMGQNFLTLEDVKSYLRISHNSDDKMIASMINSVVSFAEKFLNFHIEPKKIEISFFHTDTIILDQTPLLRIEYLSDGLNVISENEYHIKFKEILLSRKYKKIVLIGVFGILDDDFDLSLRDAMLNHIALLYDKRGNPDLYTYQAKSFYRDFRNINI